MSLTYTDNKSDAGNRTTYTFTNCSFGAAASNRTIVVCFGSRKAGAAVPSVTSATIGGVTATEVIGVDRTATNSNMVSILYAEVPTGTTGTVVVTVDQTMLRAGITVYSIIEDNRNTYDTASDIAGSDPDLVYDTSTGTSHAIAVSASTSGVTATWSELTENADFTVESNFTITSASKVYSTQTTGTTATTTFSGGSEHLGAVVVFNYPTAGRDDLLLLGVT